MSDGVSSFNVS